MELSEQDKLFIRKSYPELTLRQLAKKLNCPRSVIEKYTHSLSGKARPKNESLVNKIPVLFLALIISGITFLAFSNSLKYDFVWDDLTLVVNNPLIKDFSIKGLQTIFRTAVGEIGVSNSYRPFQNLSYWLTCHYFSLNPMVYHLTNVLLQCLAAVLLFLLLSALLKDKTISFWTASFFAIHPVQIAAVTYVSGRAESMALIFMLSSFYVFHRSLTAEGPRPFLLSLTASVLYAVSLFTKEIFLVAPILFLLYFMIYSTERKFRGRWFHFVNFGIVVAIYFAVRMSVLGKLGSGAIGYISLHDRSRAAFLVIPHYLKLLLLPSHLHMAYQFQKEQLSFLDPTVLLGIVLTGFFAVLTWFSRNSPRILFGCMWLFLFLFPVLNILVLLNSPFAEHWLYNACVGFFIMVLSFIFNFSLKKNFDLRRLELFLAGAVVCLALTTHHSNEVWKNETVLFQNTLKYVQHDPDIYCNLGAAYARRGMLREAEENFRKALTIDAACELALHNLRVLGRQKEQNGLKEFHG